MEKQKKILIIEDNKDLQEIYKLSFELEGFGVQLSDNGLTGIVEVMEYKPNVVLLDIMMPQMNGYEFLSALKNNSSMRIPVVVLSNLGQDADIRKAKELGADLFLKKANYDGAQIVRIVQDFLEKKKF